MRNSIISLALLVLLAASTAIAGNNERAGTTGATELRIPVGGRANGIGGAVVADASGAEGLFWNPAGIANADGGDASYAFTNYFADMDLNWLGFTTGMGAGTLGFGLKLLNVGDLIVTTEAAPEGTGEIISPTFSVLGISYGRALTDRVMIGTTFNVVSESILQERATGLGFDFGFQYLLPGEGLQFGLAIKNIGPKMKFAGGDLEQTFVPPGGDPNARRRTFSASSSAFELPSYVQMGASYRVVENAQNTLMLNGDFQSNSFSSDEFRGGVEWAWSNDSSKQTTIAFRGGYNHADGTGIFGQAATAGLGLNFKLGDSRMRIDYARNFNIDSDVDFFDDIDTIGLSYTF